MPQTTPLSGDPRRILSAFDAAASCKHGPAYTCGYKECNPGDPLDAVTQEGKTVKQVIGEFVADGRISQIELIEHIQGVLRRWKIKNLAKVTGKIAGITLGVVGGVVILRLVLHRDEPTGDAK